MERACLSSTLAQLAGRYGCDPTTICRWKRQYRLTVEGKAKGKLTIEEARKIRRLYLTDRYTQSKLAEMFGVTQSMVGRIVNNKAHRDHHLGFTGASEVTVRYNEVKNGTV